MDSRIYLCHPFDPQERSSRISNPCMLTGDCIHGKRTVSTRPRGEVSQRSTIFPTSPANVNHETTLAVMQPTLLWGTTKWLVGKAWRGIPGPFPEILQMVFPGIEPAIPTSHAGEDAKYFPRSTHCKPWAGFFGWKLEGTGPDKGKTTSSQHRFTNLQKLGCHIHALHSKLQPHLLIS